MGPAQALYVLKAADSIMISGKTLVALRKSEDIERITSFLNRIGQHPHLLFTMLEFRDIADDRVAKFSNTKPDDHILEDMSLSYRRYHTEQKRRPHQSLWKKQSRSIVTT